jgi:hypothetical protein
MALRFRDEEYLTKFLQKEKHLRREMADTSVTLTDDLKEAIFLTATMLPRFSTTIQLWDTIENLTAEKAVPMLINEDLRQRQETEIAGTSFAPGEASVQKDLALKANDRSFKNKDSHLEKDYWKKNPDKVPKEIITTWVITLIQSLARLYFKSPSARALEACFAFSRVCLTTCPSSF